MRMIRRTMWAAATVGLAFSAAARAQTGAALGRPVPAASDYVARGSAPTPGYPAYIPRSYVSPPADAGPTFTAAPALLPAVGAERDTPKTGPAPANTDTPKPKDAKADAPKTPGPPPTVVDGGGSSGGFAAEQATGTPVPCVPGPGAPSLSTMVGYTDGPLPNAWLSVEGLYWRLRGVTVPPLVTVAAPGSPGTLGDAATRVAFGGPDLASDWKTGYRVRAGMWFDGGADGFDVGFFSLNHVRDNFAIGSNGDPGIFRPFFNTAINAEDAQLVAFVDPVTGPIVGGRVAVASTSDLCGAEFNYRTGLFSAFGARFDVLCGYRYLRLRDTLTVNSELTTLAAVGGLPAGTTIFSADSFESTTQFHGAQVGAACEWQIGCMTFGLRGTVAAGANLERVEIAGASGSATPAGAAVTAAGGLLALPSNIGTYDRTRFAVAPEIGATVGYQVTENCRLFGGYNCLYWTQVPRAGEQINRMVNGTAIPDPTTGTATVIGAPAPTLRHPRDDYFFAHGFTFGVEFRY
jgi:hypothetical protein